MVRVFVEGIGTLAPGLEAWPLTQEVTRKYRPYEPRPVSAPPVGLLPPAERRRAGLTIRLAMAVGIEALGQARRAPEEMSMVFATSGGDGEKSTKFVGARHPAARGFANALSQLCP